MIRAARAEDYPTLQEIERAAGTLFRDVGMPEIADAEPYDDDQLASATALFVATGEDDEPIGYAMVELVDGHAHLGQISVMPERHGQGVGTRLLDAVVDWAREQGHAEVTLTTFRDVPFNAPLYAKRGYVVVPDADWTDGLRELVAREATLGLEPSIRVVMSRPVQ